MDLKLSTVHPAELRKVLLLNRHFEDDDIDEEMYFTFTLKRKNWANRGKKKGAQKQKEYRNRPFFMKEEEHKPQANLRLRAIVVHKRLSKLVK